MQVGLVGENRRPGLIHYRNIVGADAGGHADFLEALQQAVIELAVSIHLTAQDIELDAAILERQHILLELINPTPQQRFSGFGGFIVCRDRRPDVADFLIDHGVDLVDLTAQLHHRRIGRLINAEVILILSFQLSLTFLQGLNDFAVQHLT